MSKQTPLQHKCLVRVYTVCGFFICFSSVTVTSMQQVANQRSQALQSGSLLCWSWERLRVVFLKRRYIFDICELMNLRNSVTEDTNIIVI